MKKDSAIIDTKKINSKDTEWGTFPFIISTGGVYDKDKSLSYVYELYINILYAE